MGMNQLRDGDLRFVNLPRRLQGALTVLVALTAACSGGELSPVGPNIFGDIHPAPNALSPGQRRRTVLSEQTLITNHGDRLAGLLTDYRAGQVQWQHPDLPQPLNIPASDIREIQFSPAVSTPVRSLKICLKLSGGDWIAGDITSPDGCAFEWVHPCGFRWTFSRADLAWVLATVSRPYPVGFAHSPRELLGWRTGSGVQPAFENGLIVMGGADSLQGEGDFKLPLEISFAIPAECELGLRLSLQASAAFPRGDLAASHFRFSADDVEYFSEAMEHPAALLERPQDQAGDGMVHYRMLWNRQRAQIHLVRNGRFIGTFPMEGRSTSTMRYRVTFSRAPEFADQSLKFSRLQIAPWNQVLPGETPAAKGTPPLPERTGTVFGHLASLDQKMFTFAGRMQPVRDTQFFNFFHNPVPLDRAEAILDLGEAGQIAIDRVSFTKGYVHGRTSFADRISIPTLMVHRFIPIAYELPPQAARDVLVFKNGDHLAGNAFAVARGKPVQFQAFDQMLEVSEARVAGLQFAKSERRFPESPATVELRNGDRLAGNLRTLDRARANMIHPLLGPLEVPREQLFAICLDSRFRVEQGDFAFRAELPKREVFSFNGCYLFPPNDDAWLDRNPIVYRPPEEFQLYEVRFFADFAIPKIGVRVRFSDEAGEEAMELILTPGRAVSKEPQRVSQTYIPPNPRLEFRTIVNALNGSVIPSVNSQWLPNPLQSRHRLQGVAIHGFALQTPMALNHLLVPRWQKNMPTDGEDDEAMTLLKNGDVGPGAPDELRDGRFRLAKELASLEVEAGNVLGIFFGGKPVPKMAAGRVVLQDGTALLVDTFHLQRPDVIARTTAFGELRLPVEAMAEIVFDPPPIEARTTLPPRIPKAK